jgi:DNA-binding transcriptional ArsR family regulator
LLLDEEDDRLLTKESLDTERVASILSALGDINSLKILNQAVKGFKSGKSTIKQLGISQRKYYRTLKSLTENNLVRAYADYYALTPLGRVTHRLLFNDLTGFLNVNPNTLNYLDETSKVQEIKIIDDYNALSRFLVNAIVRSKDQVLLATNFIDFSVIQSISVALERGIEVNTLNDPKLDYRSFFKLIEGVHREIRPGLAKFFVDADKHYRQTPVPVSFIIIDNETALFEVPSLQFKIAFASTDRQTIKVLTEYFWDLWQQSKSLNLPKW